ncbi:MAG TPA: hypothetical protein VFV40_09285 [Nocardioides sp.]|nr:hypothetical protein [Nocardioides sp.]
MFGVVGYAVAGLVVGGLARVLRPGAHDLALPVTLGLGAAGAVTGGVLAGVLGDGAVTELDAVGFTVAVVCALALIGIVEGLTGGEAE